MDNFQAIQAFWEMFGVDAYDEQTTFDEGDLPAFPHITYESFSGTWESARTMSAHLWNRQQNGSWAWIKQKAEEIKKTIGNGIVLHVDDGVMWFRIPEYTPFAQVIRSGSDDVKIQRIFLNVEVEFLTV